MRFFWSAEIDLATSSHHPIKTCFASSIWYSIHYTQFFVKMKYEFRLISSESITTNNMLGLQVATIGFYLSCNYGWAIKSSFYCLWESNIWQVHSFHSCRCIKKYIFGSIRHFIFFHYVFHYVNYDSIESHTVLTLISKFWNCNNIILLMLQCSKNFDRYRKKGLIMYSTFYNIMLNFFSYLVSS